MADATAPGDRDRASTHAGLARQLRSLRVSPLAAPTLEQWQELLARVSATYTAADADRYLLERSVDISSEEMLALNDHLRAQARQDVLTGLPNRQALRELLDDALHPTSTVMPRQSRPEVAVLFIDLDGFKIVNDSLGHEAGDQLLRAVTERLAGIVRAGDLLARLGGDEFVVTCRYAPGTLDVVLRVAERILVVLEQPFALGDTTVAISASIGVCDRAAAGETADDVLRNADLAMYESKRLGKARISMFDEAIRARSQHRLRTEQALRRALARQEFVLHYQPILDLTTGRVLGFEALLRWDRPGVGLVLPEEFLPVAGQSGLISAIDRWVVRAACREAATWPGDELGVCVNVVEDDLRHHLGVETVEEALHSAGLPAHRLTLELTESTAMRDDPLIVATLDRLRQLGVRVAVDDFGTGWSALSYLGRLCANTLKIDRAFMDGLLDGGSGAVLVQAIVAMGRAFGLSVLAEGVETHDQSELLRSLGCDAAQGHFYAHPMPTDEVAEFLRTGVARSVVGPGLTVSVR